MLNILWLELDFLLLFVLYISKLNIFGFWTSS